MKGQEIRTRYLQFFADKGHTVVPSYSLVPDNDPSLLLIGAGMAPLKAYFTGTKTPPNRRMATSQKCVRTGDIERVGQTARHHTFFEMLGNFSFGDYFKREAIIWAWEFLLEQLQVDPDKLWVSVFHEDQEAWDIWHTEVGLAPARIVRLGKEDNFWEIGVGPCGPSSEIYYDMGPELGCSGPDCKPGCDCDRYLEVWNLVFTQYDKDEAGNYNLLPKPNIDTGMGLERMAAVLQGVKTNYDCDLVYPVIEHFAGMAQVSYGDSRYTSSLRVIADHLRAGVFMLADGILPSNDGRGYVLRRLLRRAARHGMLCGLEGSFLHTGVPVLINLFGEHYPELASNREHIHETILAEEERFLSTLRQGMELLQQEFGRLKAGGTLVGETAFRLYDTYGFPLELTREIASENGYGVDEAGFEAALERQRQQARSARGQVDAMFTQDLSAELLDLPPTRFVGYGQISAQAKILALVVGTRVESVGAKEKVLVVLDQTPFYAEGGGQVGDSGIILSSQGKIQVENVTGAEGVFIHHGRVLSGTIKLGEHVTTEVSARRRDIQANHTATHLLHKTLRDVLGEHVRQAGSLVEAERVRFDYTHSAPLSPEQVRSIELQVNALIAGDLPVDAQEMSLDAARKLGAVALFGEKYGSTVRVVSVGDISRELCGGTHVPSTARIRGFKIVSEAGIGSGVRRIEGITGSQLIRHLFELEELLQSSADAAKTRSENLPQRIGELLAELKASRAEAEKYQSQIFALQSAQLTDQALMINDVAVLARKLDNTDMTALRSQAEQLVAKLGCSVVVLGSVSGDKVNLVAAAAKDAVSRGIHAGKLVGKVAALTGGGGGGRPDMAQAGGKEPAQLNHALSQVTDFVREQLGSSE